MSETNVVTGFVSVEDGVKHDPGDQYSLSRKVRIEVGFTGDAADLDSFLDSAGNKANSKLAELLGTAVKVVEAAPAGEAKAARKPRVPKGDGATPSQSEAQPSTPAPSSDPLAGLEDGSPEADTPAPSGQSPASSAAEVLDEWEAEPVAVTDAELNAAVQKRNGELGDPTIIRKLIATFNPDPTKVFQLREIPAAQRADFLAKLAALVKA